ncbi:hypothetical protein HYY69_00400 [Candidatus Woesearchaeota archaeon]|nr:hypothetical protein [Candidatus Woesearchaeota archaeon]
MELTSIIRKLTVQAALGFGLLFQPGCIDFIIDPDPSPYEFMSREEQINFYAQRLYHYIKKTAACNSRKIQLNDDGSYTCFVAFGPENMEYRKLVQIVVSNKVPQLSISYDYKHGDFLQQVILPMNNNRFTVVDQNPSFASEFSPGSLVDPIRILRDTLLLVPTYNERL